MALAQLEHSGPCKRHPLLAAQELLAAAWLALGRLPPSCHCAQMLPCLVEAPADLRIIQNRCASRVFSSHAVTQAALMNVQALHLGY